jgi:hypothetical protein
MLQLARYITGIQLSVRSHAVEGRKWMMMNSLLKFDNDSKAFYWHLVAAGEKKMH